MADAVQDGSSVLLELVRVLIDGIVREVHGHVFHICVVYFFILLC